MSDTEKTNTNEIQRPKPNRKHKDSIFVDLLTFKDENIIQVCNALGAQVEGKHIEQVKLENITYTGLENDFSCLIDKRLLMLIEHQSTINPNMPMRCFQYAARIYEQITPMETRYATKAYVYPNPECYTFYNGDSPFPAYSELRLSDLFIDKTRPPTTELVVKVYNINYSKDNEFLKKCPILYEYALFVDQVKKNKADGRDGYDRAIRWALKNGILEEYLSMKTRVMNGMLVAEYDPELHMKVRLEEALEDGRAEGIVEGMQQGMQKGMQKGERTEKVSTARRMKAKNCDISFIMEMTGLSLDEVKAI